MAVVNDPCDDYDCYIEMVTQDYCEIPTKGPFDVDCFLPCLISNCTMTYENEDLCPVTICKQKPGPIPPGPTPPGPTPPGPTPPGPTPPGPTPPLPSHLTMIIGASVGGLGKLIYKISNKKFSIYGSLLSWNFKVDKLEKNYAK